MIETFTKQDFEHTLSAILIVHNAQPDTNSWNAACRGLEMGEYVYDIILDHKVSVRIRSSVHENGVSAGVGEDSIRLWLVNNMDGAQLSKLPNSYVTRVSGWQDRLQDCINYLANFRALSGDCPNCKHPMWVYRSNTKGYSYDRLFTSCFGCGKSFHWLEDVPHGTITPFNSVYFEPSPAVPVEAELGQPGTPFPSDEAPAPGPSSVEDGGLVVEADAEATPVEDARSALPESSVSADTAETASDSSSALDALDELEEEEVEEESTHTEEEWNLPIAPEREPNPEQAAAIYASLDGAYRVLAPPGSGKTFLLIRRIRHLLEQDVNMANILAVTFNKTMADELYRRLIELMPGLETSEATANWCKRNISTIHAACFRMLRDYGDKRQVPDREMWKIKAFLQERSIVLWEHEEDRPTWKEIIDWIYTAKFEGTEDFLTYFSDRFPDYAIEMNHIRMELDEFMQEHNWLLFGDMLYSVELLLRHDPVFTRRFQTLYKYILVDEGQDTSGQAMRILTQLAAPQDNFFIVGDTDQLLYRFAGATPELNLYDGFEQRFPNGTLIKLATNYRSTQNIIYSCNKMIRNNYSELGGPYDIKYLKNVQPTPGAVQGEPVIFSKWDSPEMEACSVVDDISVLLDTYKPQDFFIGARTRAQLTYLEPYLMQAEIPYINLAGTSFWDSRHIQDMVAFLRLCTNPYDSEAFARVYNIASNNFVHPWGDQKGEYCTHHYLPRAMLSEVQTYHNARVAVRSYRFPYKYSWKPGLEDLVELVTEMQATLETEGLPSALRCLADECYLKFLLKELGLDDEADGGPVDDINTFIAFSREFESAIDFLSYVEKARAQAKKMEDKSWDDSVVISTIHRLKGLERKVVFGIGFAEGYKMTAMGEMPAGLLPHTFSMVEPPNFGILPARGMGRIEDERCIAFVLVSRAMERVFLSMPTKYQDMAFHSSRFISEMDAKDFGGEWSPRML